MYFFVYSWIRTEYDNPETIITENGWSDNGELEDHGRIDYLKVIIFLVIFFYQLYYKCSSDCSSDEKIINIRC